MKKITKGILAAALVLLFAGVFAGAAAAADVQADESVLSAGVSDAVVPVVRDAGESPAAISPEGSDGKIFFLRPQLKPVIMIDEITADSENSSSRRGLFSIGGYSVVEIKDSTLPLPLRSAVVKEDAVAAGSHALVRSALNRDIIDAGSEESVGTVRGNAADGPKGDVRAALEEASAKVNPGYRFVPGVMNEEYQVVSFPERQGFFESFSMDTSVNPGRIQEIVGPSGTGKSVLTAARSAALSDTIRNGFDARGAAVSVNQEPAAGERFEVNSFTVVVDGKVIVVEGEKGLYTGKQKTARGEGKVDCFTKRYGGR